MLKLEVPISTETLNLPLLSDTVNVTSTSRPTSKTTLLIFCAPKSPLALYLCLRAEPLVVPS